MQRAEQAAAEQAKTDADAARTAAAKAADDATARKSTLDAEAARYKELYESLSEQERQAAEEAERRANEEAAAAAAAAAEAAAAEQAAAEAPAPVAADPVLLDMIPTGAEWPRTIVALTQGELLSDPLLSEMTRARPAEVDRVMGGEPRAWGLGVAVEDDGWGMGGTGGSTGWWSTDGRYAAAYLTSHVGDHAPATAVENALRLALDLPPL